MDPPELALHSFVPKAWLKDLASDDRRCSAVKPPPS